jgi:hypothetical protein
VPKGKEIVRTVASSSQGYEKHQLMRHFLQRQKSVL